MLSPVPSSYPPSPDSRPLPGRRWASAWIGGGMVTACLLLLLAWLQPETAKDQPVASPTFKFSLSQEREPRKEPPPPPPQAVEPKRTRPEPPPQNKARPSRRLSPTQAPRSSARRASSLSSVAGAFGGIKLASVGVGGGGPSLARFEDTHTDFAQKASKLADYLESRTQGRTRPPGPNAVRSRSVGTREPVPGPLQAPDYPRDAEKRQIEGYVKVRLLISRTGWVEEHEIVESEPAGVFDSALEKVIPQWKYTPATDREGRPVEAWVDLKYEFRFPR